MPSQIKAPSINGVTFKKLGDMYDTKSKTLLYPFIQDFINNDEYYEKFYKDK